MVSNTICSKKMIAGKCKSACLKAIQSLANREQDYTRTFVKLKQEERDSVIRLSNLSKMKNTETHISLCKQNLAQKFLNLQILRDQNKTEKMHISII